MNEWMKQSKKEEWMNKWMNEWKNFEKVQKSRQRICLVIQVQAYLFEDTG